MFRLVKISNMTWTIILAIAATSFVAGCADSEAVEDSEDSELRTIYFNAAEVNAEIAQNPDLVFFADIRDGAIVEFDQTEADFDFSHFVFQCPSMAAPVPMEGFMGTWEGDAHHADLWKVESTPDTDEGFRGLNCQEQGCPGDCVWVCRVTK